MIWEIIVAAICGLILIAVVHLLTAKDRDEAAMCLMAVAAIAVAGAIAGVIVAGTAWLIKLVLFV